MNNITRKIAITGAALVSVFALSACSTPSDTASSGSTTLSREDSSYSFEQDAIQYAWDNTSSSEQVVLCDFYLTYPQDAFAAFNQGAEGTISQSAFTLFFDTHC